jgi:hypothetical protein
LGPVHADDTGPFSPLTFQNGIVFNHPEDHYDLHLRFRMQTLLQYNSISATDLRPAEINPQIRRLRLRFGGWVYRPEVRFNLQLSFSRRDMDWDGTGIPNVARDAAVVWEALPGWQIAFGQTKLPGNRQRVVSSGDQQFIDRSIVNGAYNLDRDFGIQMRYGMDHTPVAWSVEAALTSGEGRNILSTDSGLNYTLRAEVLPLGEFKENGDYFEGDLAFEEQPKLSFGVGANYNHAARRAAGTLGTLLNEGVDLGTVFADALLKWRGFSLSAEWLGRGSNRTQAEGTSGAPVSIPAGFGLNVQAGYLFVPGWEAVARFSWLEPWEHLRNRDAQVLSGVVGINRYLLKHRVKAQVDLGYQAQWISRFQVELGI